MCNKEYKIQNFELVSIPTTNNNANMEPQNPCVQVTNVYRVVYCMYQRYTYVCMCGYKADEKTITAAATAMTTTKKQ